MRATEGQKCWKLKSHTFGKIQDGGESVGDRRFGFGFLAVPHVSNEAVCVTFGAQIDTGSGHTIATETSHVTGRHRSPKRKLESFRQVTVLQSAVTATGVTEVCCYHRRV